MEVFYTIQDIKSFVDKHKNNNKTIGFVPTMGALHQGHLSLIDKSVADTDITIASIFVNPTQFNNPDDLKNYPRDIDTDLKFLSKQGCNAVFVPSEKEMYPEKDTRVFDFDRLDLIMEGEHRPGHFNGVAQIVSKLFDTVSPHKAFFGQKDFQQVAIIRKMIEKLNYNIDIVACEIIREPDGLAMSSRNLLLTPEHRKAAPVIYKTLLQSKKQFKKFISIDELKNFVYTNINNIELLNIEYFEVVEEKTLQPVKEFKKGQKLVGSIAVWAGKVRLIDNIIYNY
jgi:pantoate--beta-alanine ligase